MRSYSRKRIRRRKRQRDQAVRDLKVLAQELGLELIHHQGIRPEIMYDAVQLLREARDMLPFDVDVVGYSASPQTGVYLMVGNKRVNS